MQKTSVLFTSAAEFKLEEAVFTILPEPLRQAILKIKTDNQSLGADQIEQLVLNEIEAQAIDLQVYPGNMLMESLLKPLEIAILLCKDPEQSFIWLFEGLAATYRFDNRKKAIALRKQISQIKQQILDQALKKTYELNCQKFIKSLLAAVVKIIVSALSITKAFNWLTKNKLTRSQDYDRNLVMTLCFKDALPQAFVSEITMAKGWQNKELFIVKLAEILNDQPSNLEGSIFVKFYWHDRAFLKELTTAAEPQLFLKQLFIEWHKIYNQAKVLEKKQNALAIKTAKNNLIQELKTKDPELTGTASIIALKLFSKIIDQLFPEGQPC